MTSDFVVQERGTGVWVFGCCDDMHGWTPYFEEHKTRAAAQRAATRHRACDRKDRARHDAEVTGCCPTCGRGSPK